jgi:hypothetical protein
MDKFRENKSVKKRKPHVRLDACAVLGICAFASADAICQADGMFVGG